MSIYKKLLEVQKRVIGLGKDKKSFGYDYVTGSKVLEHIKPILNEQGLLLKQEVIKIEKERIDYKSKNGEKSEMHYSVYQKFTWIDTETGEKDVNEFFANGMNDWEKGFGSALTYAERYFLLKYFHIATDEDDIDNPERKDSERKDNVKNDTQNGKTDSGKTEEPKEMITPEQVKLLHTLITKTKTDPENLKKHYGVNSSKEFTKEKAAEVIKILQKKQDKMESELPATDDPSHTMNTENK